MESKQKQRKMTADGFVKDPDKLDQLENKIRKSAYDLAKSPDQLLMLEKAKKLLEKFQTGGSPGLGTPKDLVGLSDAKIDEMYAMAYRVYNLGKHKEASGLFQLLVILNPMESKYWLGLAACHHMLKNYGQAAQLYGICGIFDPNNPIPHYHASDCYLKLEDPIAAYAALEMTIKRAGDKLEFKNMKDRAVLTLEGIKKKWEKQKIL